jgi:hypothetical protein
MKEKRKREGKEGMGGGMGKANVSKQKKKSCKKRTV